MRKTIATATLALFVAAAATAQPGPQAGRGQGAGQQQFRVQKHLAMVEKLNLTEQQKTQMHKLQTDMQKSRIQLDAKIQLARLDLRELFMAEKPDKAALEKKTKEISDLQHQLKVAGIEHYIAVHGMLTPEQQKTFRESRGQGMGGMMGPQQRIRIMRRMGAPMGENEPLEDFEAEIIEEEVD